MHQSAKMVSECTICIRFSKISSGRSPEPPPRGIFPHGPTPPPPPNRSKIGIRPPPAVHLVSGFVTDNAMYIFNATLLKIQLSLSEFIKHFICTPDCTSLHHFFKCFLGGGPRTPTNGRDTPPVPSPLGTSGLENAPPPSQVEFWIRHCKFTINISCAALRQHLHALILVQFVG